MKKGGTIRPEQIRQAQKLLNELPVKDDKKSRDVAAARLENDFRKAIKKGYTPNEIDMMLKNSGIIIPAYLTEKFLKPENETSQPQKKETIANLEGDMNLVSSLPFPPPLEKL